MVPSSRLFADQAPVWRDLALGRLRLATEPIRELQTTRRGEYKLFDWRSKLISGVPTRLLPGFPPSWMETIVRADSIRQTQLDSIARYSVNEHLGAAPSI
jgi:hypothetical protein